MTVTTANKVRLWIAGACQLIGFILLISIPTSTGNGSGYYYVANGNGVGLEVWSGIFLAAATVLAAISLYRFVKPQMMTEPRFCPNCGKLKSAHIVRGGCLYCPDEALQTSGTTA
jgi:ribosomal protein S27AE